MKGIIKHKWFHAASKLLKLSDTSQRVARPQPKLWGVGQWPPIRKCPHSHAWHAVWACVTYCVFWVCRCNVSICCSYKVQRKFKSIRFISDLCKDNGITFLVRRKLFYTCLNKRSSKHRKCVTKVVFVRYVRTTSKLPEWSTIKTPRENNDFHTHKLICLRTSWP